MKAILGTTLGDLSFWMHGFALAYDAGNVFFWRIKRNEKRILPYFYVFRVARI